MFGFYHLIHLVKIISSSVKTSFVQCHDVNKKYELGINRSEDYNLPRNKSNALPTWNPKQSSQAVG